MSIKTQLLAGFLVLLQSSAGIAEVVTDGSLGSGGALNGPDFDITHDLGRIQGSNLFHSFSEFNLSSSESATFSGPASIANILSRVTGGNPSNIDGTLRSSINGANLYFLNPNGVFFGPNATIDVSGSFVASTADYLKLQDGGVFQGSLDAVDTLTTAPPSAFGFSSADVGAITFVGNEIVVSEGQSFAAVGGDIMIDGSEITAPGGQVNLVSVASAGEVGFMAENGDLGRTGINGLGEVSIAGSSEVNADGAGGGRIFIRGDQVVVEDSVLTARTLSDEAGQGVDIAVDGQFDFIRSLIDTRTSGSGEAGAISILADHMVFDTLLASYNTGIFSGSVNELSVLLDISHTWDSDLIGTVISPFSTEVVLFSDTGGGGDDFTTTRFADSAALPITDGTAPFTGSFQPTEPLSTFDGEALNGEWTLRIEDTASGDGGSLNSWSLLVNEQSFDSTDVPKVIDSGGPNTIESTLAVTNAPTVGDAQAGAITITANQLDFFVETSDFLISATAVDPGILDFDIGKVTRYGVDSGLIVDGDGSATLAPIMSRIAYDGSLSGSPGPALRIGDDYFIEPGFGRVAGDNLFHSFSDFILLENETATFQGDSGTARIIARVTGGNALFIDGLVRSDLSGVDLFLLNPEGIVFGPHGSIDPGSSFASLTTSTAGFISWADGMGRFDAVEPTVADRNLLAAGEPETFGFLTDNVRNIDVFNGGWTANEGKTITFIGGDLRFAGLEGAEAITAPFGAINLISLASTGELLADEAGVSFETTSFSAFGTISLNRFSLDVSGDLGGGMFVYGRDLVLKNESSLLSRTLGGERVRLLSEESEPQVYAVEAVTPDSFQTSLDFEGEVFVYGREVSDFHVVDYDALSMLHISATQELYKIINALKMEIQELKTQLHGGAQNA